jgi:hypothetical protein
MKIYKDPKQTKAAQTAARMPILRHNIGEPFDIRRSEVLNWLCEQPEIRQSLFDYFRTLGVIVFNKETGQWQGISNGNSNG